MMKSSGPSHKPFCQTATSWLFLSFLDICSSTPGPVIHLASENSWPVRKVYLIFVLPIWMTCQKSSCSIVRAVPYELGIYSNNVPHYYSYCEMLYLHLARWEWSTVVLSRKGNINWKYSCWIALKRRWGLLEDWFLLLMSCFLPQTFSNSCSSQLDSL